MPSLSSRSLSINEFQLAIQSMATAAVQSELSRLRNSIAHLIRSNDDLKTALQESDDQSEKRELADVIEENQQVIRNQHLRESIIVSHLESQGYDNSGGDSYEHQGTEGREGQGDIQLEEQVQEQQDGQQDGLSESGVYL